MFDLEKFAQDNSLFIANKEEAASLQLAIMEGKETGFTCDGAIGGMIPAPLQDLGTNLPFENGIFVSCKKAAPCRKLSAFLVPKAVCVGISAERDFSVDLLEDSVGILLSKLDYWKQSIGSVAVDEGLAGNQALADYCRDRDLELKAFPKAQWEKASVPMSEADILVGKEPPQLSQCEKLALCGAPCGELLTGKVDFETVSIAFSRENYSVLFS